MPLKPLQPRHANAILDHVQKLPPGTVVDPHPRPDSEEVEHGQAAGVTPGPARGKRVIRPRAVIAQYLGAVGAHEQAAVVRAPSAHVHRIRGLDLEVLRRETVAHGDALVHVPTQDRERLTQSLRGRGPVRLRK